SAGFGAILVAFVPLLYSLGDYAHDLGIPPERAAAAAAMAALAMAPGKLTFGRLADWFSHRFLYRVGAIMIAAGIVVVSLSHSFTMLLAGLVLTNFGQGCYLPMLSSMIVSRFGAAAFGQVLGLAIVLIQLSAVAPYLSGLIRDATGGYGTAFLIM